jgi:ABC-type branched-subunit amino acid transport system ATPase component/ABC-type branched-subunit amino acid transport system permease subunit
VRSTLPKLVLTLALFIWPLAYANTYWMNVMTTAGLYAILTIAVGLILGQAGQLSFGHTAFYGVGAYTAAILSGKLGVPTLAGLAAGAAAAGFVALLVGRPVLKLRYFYLALATIGLGQIFVALVTQLRSLTGGLNGFAGIPHLSVFGFHANSFLRKYYVVWIVAILILLFVQRLLKYRVGRSLRAIATSEIASVTLGIRTANWKLVTFVATAIFCGLAGGLYTFVQGVISPSSFAFNASVLPMVMMLVGGHQNIWGNIIGAIIMTWVVQGFSGAQQYSGIAYSLILIFLLLFLPAGLLGGLRPEQRKRLVALFRKLRPREDVACAGAAEMDEPDGQCDTTVGLPAVATGIVAPVGTVPAGRSGRAAPAVPGCEPDREFLRIEGLMVTFGGLKAVNDVSLTAGEGEITALIGPNGAGKTTLFNAVSRIQKLTAGRIWFAGTELTGMTPANTARLGMTRTFQNLRIFSNMSVLENVLVGCHRHERSGYWACGLGLPHQRREERLSRTRAMAALALVGLEEQANKQAASLPYGQQRLVEIARALASQPRLLMLDEPAAGMNATERADLVSRIRRIRESGVTVLLVEHDIGLVMGISDHVHVLDYGRLIASGTPEEVQKDEAVIRAYLGTKREAAGTVVEAGSAQVAGGGQPSDLLVVKDLTTAYGSIQALRDFSSAVKEGEVVAVVGANGAGKTTLLHTISGLLRPSRGSVTYQGVDITRVSPDKIASRGLCQVPEGRQLFPTLSVEDNLVVGSSGLRHWRKTFADDLSYVYEMFPILGERRRQLAGRLSGGEQQMLAIGRALVGRPKLLLLDEPSMGLAPQAVERIFDAIARLNNEGLTILMVEQNGAMALSVADRVIVLRTGAIAFEGDVNEFQLDDRLRVAYLGEAAKGTRAG